LQEAKKQADHAQEIGTIVGAAQGVVGAKMASVPLKSASFSTGYQQAIGNLLKKNGYELGKVLLEGAAQGGIGALGEVAKNKLAQSIGIDRELDAGTADQFWGNVMMAGGIAVGIKAGRGLSKLDYKRVLHGLSKLPEEQIGGALQEKVQSGEITQEAADQTIQRINDYKALDQLIPDNVTEEARFKIQDKITKRNELEQKLETTDKAYHPEIKEKIKAIDEEIVALSKETEKPPKTESGLTKSQEKEAIETAEEFLSEGIFPEIYAQEIQRDPIGFWKTIAQQAQNRDEQWRPLKEPLEESVVREQFGDTVVDYAKELFPAPDLPASTENVSVIMPGEIKQPETITIKPKEDAIPEKGSLTLDENLGYGKQNTNKDLFPERSQTQPRIDRKTAADIIGEAQAARLQTSLEWLDAIAGNDTKKSANAAQELVRQSMASEGQVGDVLGDINGGRQKIRTQGDYGTEIGSKTSSEGARTPQGSQQPQQPSGQSGIVKSLETRKSSFQGSVPSNEGAIIGLNETERGAVVKEVQKLSGLSDDSEKTYSSRILFDMLEQGIRENKPQKVKEIIDLITENLPDYEPLRQRSSKVTDVDETPRDSETVVGGIPESGETAIPQEGKPEKQQEGSTSGQEKVGQPREIGITHRQMDEIAEELGFDTYEKSPEKVREWDEQAAQRLTQPEALTELFTKLRNGVPPDPVETRMMVQYMGDLMAKIDVNPGDEALLEQAKRAKDLFNIAGRLQGKSLVARKGSIPAEERLGDFLIRDMEVNKAPLTEQQKAQSIKEYEQIKAAKDALDEKVMKLQAENAKLKAEKIVKEQSKTKSKSRTDFASERKKIITDIKEKLRKARGETSVVAVPYAKELIAIAPDVVKLAKSYIEQGITELPELVKHIRDAIKEDIPQITDNDVHNIIAGEYNQKKPTRSQLFQQLFDLRTEAKLINDLEALQRGEEPKTERKRIQRNRKIEELRGKIKDLHDEMGLNERTDADKLSALKSRYKKQIAELEDKISKGDYGPDEKPEPLKLDKEAEDLRNKYQELKREREVRLAKEEFENRTNIEKVRDWGIRTLNTPREIMASVDFSAPMRQGLVATVSHPTMAMKAFPEMFRQAFSPKQFDQWLSNLKESPDYKLIEDSGLYVADPNSLHLGAKEEQFMGSLVTDIPILRKTIGAPVKASERAYVSYLNKMRVDIFRQGVELFESQGRTFENSPELYKGLADYINNSTGRGGLGPLNKAAPVLNTAFFSPRLIASRINLLNPYYYVKLPKAVRIMALKDMAKTIAFGVSLLGLAKAAGADVETDPRSPDFGKIRVGNTRWDIWGGFQQYVRIASQIWSGKAKSASGAIRSLDGESFPYKTRLDQLGSFFRGKLAPVPGTVVDMLAGKNVVGEEFDPAKKVSELFIPMIAQDINEAWKDQGVKALFTIGLPSAFGVGTTTYKPKPPKKSSKSSKKGLSKSLKKELKK
jgi:hypothetical protein